MAHSNQDIQGGFNTVTIHKGMSRHRISWIHRTDRTYVGAMQMGGGLLPRPAWVRGGRRYQVTYECHVEKTALRRAVIPSNHTQVFLQLNPQKSVSQGGKPCREKGGQLTHKGGGKISGARLMRKNLKTGDSAISCPAVSITIHTVLLQKARTRPSSCIEHRDVQTTRSSAGCQIC